MTATMTGTQKAALVIMQLSQGRAAEVMRQFSEGEAAEIAAEIIRLRQVDDAVTQDAVAEFHARTRRGRTESRGGQEVAASLLEASFGQERAAGLLDRAKIAAGSGPFEFLDGLDPAALGRALADEQPAVVALVLAQVDPETASSVLGALDAEGQAEVAWSLAALEPAHPEVLRSVAGTLREQLRTAVAPTAEAEAPGGVQRLIGIIERADPAAEQALLDRLAERDPGLAEQVRAGLLGFDDLGGFDDLALQQILRGIDAGMLAIALRGADETFVQRVRANISERNRDLLDEEVGLLGAVRKPQQLEARALLVRAARGLRASGAIRLAADEPEEADDLVD